MITVNFVDLCLHKMPCFVEAEMGDEWERPEDRSVACAQVKAALDRCKLKLAEVSTPVCRGLIHTLDWERLNLAEVWHMLATIRLPETVLGAGPPSDMWNWLYRAVLTWHHEDPRLCVVADRMAQVICSPALYSFYVQEGGWGKLRSSIFCLERMWPAVAAYPSLVSMELDRHSFHVDALGTSEPL